MEKQNNVTINCHDVLDRLSAYVDSELSDEQMKQIRLHLDGCPQCQVEYNELCNLWVALADPVSIPVPANLEERVMRVIDKRVLQNTQQSSRLRRLITASAVAAVLGLVVGGWMGVAILDKDRTREIGHSISATFDIFSPAPQGTFAEGYFAMLHNPESR